MSPLWRQENVFHFGPGNKQIFQNQGVQNVEHNTKM